MKKLVKIILALKNSGGRNVAFVGDNLATHSLAEAVDLARNKEVEAVHVVRRAGTFYLRNNPDVKKRDTLGAVSISQTELRTVVANSTAPSLPAMYSFWNARRNFLLQEAQRGEKVVHVDGNPICTQDYLVSKLLPIKQHIGDAAKYFSIDPYLVGAIFADEIARYSPFEDIGEYLFSSIEQDVSVGFGQVKIETARSLIKKGYYNPDPKDKNFNEQNIIKTRRSYIYKFLVQPKHNAYFAVALMASFADEWKKFVDLRDKPEIIATLYHLGNKAPHAKPVADDRGLQISKEFYALVREILGEL